MPLLLSKPFAPVGAGLCAIAALARWHQVLSYRQAAGHPGQDVAVLTGLIPVITLLGPKHGSQPTYPVVVTLVLMVVALAALQLYGQNRENLERIESKNNFDEQETRIDRIGVGVESVLAAIQGGAGNDIEVEASKQTEGRDEERVRWLVTVGTGEAAAG